MTQGMPPARVEDNATTQGDESHFHDPKIMEIAPDDRLR